MKHTFDKTMTRQEMDDWVHNDSVFGWAFGLATIGFLIVFGPFWLAYEIAHQFGRVFKRLGVGK